MFLINEFLIKKLYVFILYCIFTFTHTIHPKVRFKSQKPINRTRDLSRFCPLPPVYYNTPPIEQMAVHIHSLFYKNQRYKNTEAEIQGERQQVYRLEQQKIKNNQQNFTGSYKKRKIVTTINSVANFKMKILIRQDLPGLSVY